MSKLIRIQSENIKRLFCVEIEPTGNVIFIGGKNGHGKSSLLDSIELLFTNTIGSKTPKMPVRRGEEKGRIIGEIDDLIIKRTFTAAGGDSLVVTDKDGAKKSSPQTLLDKLTGKLTFDPLEFSRQRPPEQAETLRKLVGLDFTEHDKQHQKLYDERTSVNRDAKALQNRLAAMPKHEGAPEKEVSASDVLAEQQKAAEQNAANQKARQSVNASASSVRIQEGSIARIKDEIAKLTEMLVGLQANLKRRQDEHAEFEKAAEGLQDIDLAPFREKASKVESDNRRVRENAARADVAGKFKAKDKEADDLTKKIEAMDSDRKKKTTAAKYPIEGLMFDTAGGVTIGGIPFEQASTAEQLKVSVAIGIALNPTLKVLLIRHGNDLDEDSLKLIVAMAAEHDVQIWIEVVDPKDPSAVIIEDGRVKGAEQPEQPELAELEKGTSDAR